MLHTKSQPNISCHSGEKVNFIGYASFGIGGHLGFSTGLGFIIQKPCSLVMLHVKVDIHGCIGFRKEAI